LVEETGIPRDKLYHIMLYTLPWTGFRLSTLVVIGTDWTGSYKSNNHTTTTAPDFLIRLENFSREESRIN
jgi:hypothetical protein